MLVLVGNNPRFPWEPSSAMLTYRLTGTTDESASYRNGPHHSAPVAVTLPRATTGDGFAKNLRSPRRALKGSVLLTRHGADVWWLVPLVVLAALAASVLRVAVRSRDGTG